MASHLLELDFGTACVLVTVGDGDVRATVVLTNDERDLLAQQLLAHKHSAQLDDTRITITRY